MKGIAMERYISTITNKFTTILGIISQVSLKAIGTTFSCTSFRTFVRSLGMRLAGATMASMHMKHSCAHLALAVAVTAPVQTSTGKRVRGGWRPARMAWRDLGQLRVR
jgi:hypothetical protein